MNEKLLQYIWNYRLFSGFNFVDTNGNPLEILDYGTWNHNSGPDFSFAKIKTKDFVLAGNIELHLRSSDWILHQHSENSEFKNIILHVVFMHDCEINDLTNLNIPTLELKNFIDEKLFWKYEKMMMDAAFIPCESIFDIQKTPINFQENQLLSKLNERSTGIETQLKQNKNDYEAVLFHELAYAFGLKVNADIFRNIAESIPYSVIRKTRNNLEQINALLYGKADWLKVSMDENTQLWKREFDFLKHKFELSPHSFSPKFLRLRPQNFPTIRISQFAALLHQYPSLFQMLMEVNSVQKMPEIFSIIQAHPYWDDKFVFGKTTSKIHSTFLTKNFVDLILINAVLPIKYTWLKNENENTADEILEFYEAIKPEKNSVIDKWKNLKIKMNSAKDTQAFLYHYKNFCLPKNCLNCSIGYQLLREQ